MIWETKNKPKLPRNYTDSMFGLRVFWLLIRVIYGDVYAMSTTTGFALGSAVAVSVFAGLSYRKILMELNERYDLYSMLWNDSDKTSRN